MNTDSCDMRLIEAPPVADWELCQPGDFWWDVSTREGAARRLMVMVPGCGVVGLPVNAAKGWTWDGDELQPTIQPSVLTSPSEDGEWIQGWHGFITKGRMVSC